MNICRLLIEDESAVTLTHYTMLMALVSIAAIGTMNVFMTSVDGMVERIGEAFEVTV